MYYKKSDNKYHAKSTQCKQCGKEMYKFPEKHLCPRCDKSEISKLAKYYCNKQEREYKEVNNEG